MEHQGTLPPPAAEAEAGAAAEPSSPAAASASTASPAVSPRIGHDDSDEESFGEDSEAGGSSDDSEESEDTLLQRAAGMVHATSRLDIVRTKTGQDELVDPTDDATGSILLASVVNRLHWGLDPESTKYKVGRIVESQRVEYLVLFMVLVDLALVSIECGIYHHMICINGEIVKQSALTGQPLHEPSVQEHFRHQPVDTQRYLSESAAAAVAPGDLLEERVRSASAVLLQRATEALPAALVGGLGTAAATGGGGAHGSPIGDVIAGAVAPLVSGAVRRFVEPSVGDGTAGTAAAPVADVLAALAAPRGWRVAAANATELADLRGGFFLAELRGYSHSDPGGEPVVLLCEDRSGDTAHALMLWCDCISVAIVLLFLVELLVKMWVNPKFFRGSRLHMMDLVVVVMSLLADIVNVCLFLWNIPIEVKLLEMFLVMIRLWRIARIIHTAFSMWYHAKAPLKEKVKSQKYLLKTQKEKIRILRSLAGLQTADEKELRSLVAKMNEKTQEPVAMGRASTASAGTTSENHAAPPAG